MATLTGNTIASTYALLLKIDNTGIAGDGTLRKVEDGDATDSALSLSDVSIAVDATDKIFLDGGSDTYIFESGADVLDFYVGGANMLKLTESTLDTIAMTGNATLTHTVTTSASTPIGLLIDSNTSGVAAQDSVGLHVDFDRTVAGSGTAAHNDIGINLDVNSASLGTSSLVGMDIDVVGATSGTSTATGLAVTVGSADTNYAALFTGGNVGIGTNAPLSLLHVQTSDVSVTPNASADNLVVEENGNAGISIISGTGSTGNLTWGDTTADMASISYSHSTNDMSFRVNSTNDVMTIDSSGNVGIGTSTPAEKLTVGAESGSGTGDNVSVLINTETNGNAYLRFNAASDESEGAFIKFDHTAGASASQKLQFGIDWGGDSPKMTMTGDGNLGIGDTSPDAHLDVEDLTVDTTTSYTGIISNHTKTLGATDDSDSFTGISSYVTWDDDGALDSYFGTASAFYGQIVIDDSVGASSILQGIGLKAKLVIGNPDNVYGANVITDIDGGTVDSDVYAEFLYVDIDGGTLSGNVYGQKILVNTTVTPSGVNFGHQIVMEGGGMHASTDMFMYYYDGQNSDAVAQITALEGVATFDDGDFAGAPDYAEYFESKDGNAIAVGKTVKLDGDKVVACSEGDTPIGVVRPDGVGTSAYKAGAQNLRWHGKYLYDDYNELQMEDYEIVEWTEEITFEEYIARGKDETGGVLGGNVKDEKVEGSKAIPAKDAVTQQKTVDEEVEEEVTTTEVVLEDGKYVQKTTTETVTKTVSVPQYDEEDLYDEDGEVIGKHQVPIMETVEEAVSAVDAVPDTYSRKHSYHSDRIPDGITVPDDAETVTPNHQRKKLNPDYDASLHDSYKPRPKRDEWCLIGLLGQIPITKGQPLASNWTKMKDVSDTVEMYFVK